MKAIIFDGKLRAVKDHPAPIPKRGEALIKVLMAGICNTDLEIIKGYQGFKGVLGHEFVGVVEKPKKLKGRRVVGEINLTCGACQYCLGGLKTHCPDRTVLGIHGKDGAMAEYLTLPIENLHEVPDNVTDEEAVFTEPLAAAFEILEQVHIKSTDKVLVMGDGKLGLLASMVLNLTQCDLALVGKHRSKLDIAKAQGINTLLLKDLAMGKSYDVVIEATGAAAGFETALALTRPSGTIVLKSTVAEKSRINLFPLVVDEIKVVGSRCGPFAPALKALSKKLVDVRPLIRGVFGFDQDLDAFKRAKGSLKAIIDFR
jgi:threonine dehydrogenase-like Zn-dependent dehydrogenase